MIYRRRKRPRVRSGSFRTLFWVIRITAQFHVISRFCAPMSIFRARRVLFGLRASKRARWTARVLRAFPERAVFP